MNEGVVLLHQFASTTFVLSSSLLVSSEKLTYIHILESETLQIISPMLNTRDLIPLLKLCFIRRHLLIWQSSSVASVSPEREKQR